MPIVKMLLVAEMEVPAENPAEEAQCKLDEFRESVLPHENYGISMYHATRTDLEEFATQQALLPNPQYIIDR